MDESRINKQMRVKLAGQLGQVWPELVQIVLHYYLNRCKEKSLIWLHFKVHDLPISLNSMYKRGKSYKSKSGKILNSTYLHPKINEYRLLVMEALGEKRWQWKPTGVTAAIILLESPTWITKRRQVREMDADNKVKPIFDAIEVATETPDELHWQFHVFKIPSKWTRTTVYLFDLGDVVEYYS